jgi:hypothetical protein
LAADNKGSLAKTTGTNLSDSCPFSSSPVPAAGHYAKFISCFFLLQPSQNIALSPFDAILIDVLAYQPKVKRIKHLLLNRCCFWRRRMLFIGEGGYCF